MVSRVVWDLVVSPGWLDGPRDSLGNFERGADECCCKDLFRAAEALFPIVGLVCRRVLAFVPLAPRWGFSIGSYTAIMSAASVPAPSCVAWIVSNRRGHHPQSIYDGGRRWGGLSHDPVGEWWSRAKTRGGGGGAADDVAGRPEDATATTGGGGGGGRGRRGVVDVVVKEVGATVVGLLVGGHVGMATCLFGGAGEGGRDSSNSTRRCTLPRLWDGRRVVGWETATDCGSENGNRNGNGGGDEGDRHYGSGGGGGAIEPTTKDGVSVLRQKVIVYVKEYCQKLQFVEIVCASGCVDSVRWLVDVFGIDVKEAQWVMGEALGRCMTYGKIEVVKWLFESCPSNLKWCFENIPVAPDKARTLPRAILSNENITLEECQLPCVGAYIRDRGFSYVLKDVRNPDVVKWLLTTFPPPSKISEEALNSVCKNTGNWELVQWLVTEHNFTPTAATFASACSTPRKKGSTLAKWLSTRVSLSQSDIIKSLVCALNWYNIEVAEWLEATFHVMDAVNSNTQVAENCLVELCTDPGDHTDRGEGLEWFLQHLSPSQASTISMTCIHEAISHTFQIYRTTPIAVLLTTFTACEPHQDPSQFKEIVIEAMKGYLEVFQHLCSGSCSTFLTPEFVGDCLTSSSFFPYSSKFLKWVIRKFNVQYTQIKANNNLLLFKLLTRRKTHCAQWFIEYFDVPLSDIVSMAPLASADSDSLDVEGWHMILNHYGPTIDATLIREHLMPLVSHSPYVAIQVINSFGLTVDEFRDYVVTMIPRPKHYFPKSVRLWLGVPL
ncbi:hypothetical protein Pelo_17315 [Pelomyxa schiedti]|nr:hypothetical protein Pelo_17315 [Pelomyxa schiedti]